MTVNIFSPTADGVFAALLAPFFMSLGFFIWDRRWTASGASAFALNMYKCNVASIGFIIMCLARGFSISNEISTISSSSSVFTITSVGYLILSSTLGIIVGDVLWLEALRLLGAKHVIVIDSLKPFMAAILGRVALDEVLRPPAWGGMVLTVVGVGVIAWEEQRVALRQEEEDNAEGDDDDDGGGGEAEKNLTQTQATARVGFGNDENVVDDFDDNNPRSSINSKQQSSIIEITNNNDNNSTIIERKHYKRGYICAIINVLADSLGSLLTKQYGVGMTTWSINLIRFGFAGVVLACISTGMRFRRRYSQSKKLPERLSGVELCNDATIRANGNTTPVADDDDQEPNTPLWFELPTLTRTGWLQITAGVGLVTFLCPALSNYALFQIALGLAVSLSSIGPLYGLFMDWPFKGRRPTLLGCVGVCLAIAGVVILCVWGT